MVAFYSLFSICLFHKTEGFFFKDISRIERVYVTKVDPATNSTVQEIKPLTIAELQSARAPIMVVLGSNTLGALAATILTIVVLLPLFRLLLVRFLRITSADELIGQDIANGVHKREDLRNHLDELINQYYPANIGDYLMSKYQLVMKYKDGSTAAADRLENEDVGRLLRYLGEEIANQEKKEAYAK